MVPYGGFWWRSLAYIIDSIILNIVASIVGGIFGLGFVPGTGAATAGMVGGISISLILSWLYFALMESSSTQATVGKLAVGLIVTDEQGQRISFGKATGRYFGKILSSLIIGIGFIMVAFTERKQGLHDILAKTLVYKTRDPRAVWDNRDVFA
ncbi:RDD family protein [Novosphingobium sp. Leaf2]|uniref:RDD family protein n=1 Tax=Novosphingobium sp. Leaf2 TaxID=1735670 RepID=UPI0006FB4CEF|nr:RDD family protein [Novosphingobium sp. Leaf2]KQM19598.1 transporter [Novosphingobium sp. Leaf2]